MHLIRGFLLLGLIASPVFSQTLRILEYQFSDHWDYTSLLTGEKSRVYDDWTKNYYTGGNGLWDDYHPVGPSGTREEYWWSATDTVANFSKLDYSTGVTTTGTRAIPTGEGMDHYRFYSAGDYIDPILGIYSHWEHTLETDAKLELETYSGDREDGQQFVVISASAEAFTTTGQSLGPVPISVAGELADDYGMIFLLTANNTKKDATPTVPAQSYKFNVSASSPAKGKLSYSRHPKVTRNTAGVQTLFDGAATDTCIIL